MRDFLLTAPTAREIWVALNKSSSTQQGMREFALSERAASELWRALSASTAISTPQAPASSSSPAPIGASAAPVPIVAPTHNPFADIPAKYQHADVGPYPARYDDPMPEGTVGSVKMLITGHVLSMPQPQYGPDGKQVRGQGESFIPYVRRVRYQITANADGTPNAERAQQVVNALGFLMQSSSTLKSFVAENPDTWPFAADEFINQEAYHPVDPAQAAAVIKAWSDAQQLMRDQAAAAGTPVPVVPPTGPVVVEAGGSAPI